MSKKIQLTMSDFRAIIKEEAIKLKKKIVLENEKKTLESELKKINETYESYDEEMGPEIEEGMIGDFLGTSSKAKSDKLKKDFLEKAKIWKMKGVIRGMNTEMLEKLMNQAELDKFEGAPGFDKETGFMTYKPSDAINWKGASSSIK